MKKIVVIFLFSLHVYGQNNEKLSFSFDDLSLVLCIDQIEDNTLYHFYYIETWLAGKTISKHYIDEDIDFILKDLLANSPLNYYRKGSDIYLTRNNRIREPLETLFDLENDTSKNSSSKPTFSKDYTEQSLSNLMVIGKESDKERKWGKITGVVKNAYGEVLGGVSVLKLGNLATSVTSNRKGEYAILLPIGQNNIVCELDGYNTARLELLVLNDGILNVEMEDIYTKLETVEITAKKNNQVEKVALGITNIDVSGIKKIPNILGERDLLRVATTMPGVKSTGEGSQGFNIRGGKSDQNLIILNNAVLYNPSHYFGMFSAITSSVIEKVDIHKGSVPIEYGGRLSSLINIETKDFKGDKVIGEGSLGIVSSSLMLGVPISKKIGVLSSFRTSNTNWILREIPNTSLQNKRLSFYDGLVTLNYNINPKNRVKSTAYFSQDHFNTTNDSIYKYSNQLASIEWNYAIKEHLKLTTQLSSSRYNFHILYNGHLENSFDFGFNINETVISSKVKHKLNKNHRLTYGISQKYYKLSPGTMDPIGEESTVEQKTIETEQGLESALFISDNINISANLSVMMGIRYAVFAKLGKGTQYIYYPDKEFAASSLKEIKYFDDNQVMQYYGVPEIRASVRYLLNEDLSLKASVNQNTQFLHTLSNNTTASPVDTWTLSNHNIEPQKSTLYSVGVYKNMAYDSYVLSVEGYYKTMTNTIDFKTGAQLYMNNTIETKILNGTGKAYGVEFLLKKNQGKLNGWLSYTYSRAFLKLQGKSLISTVNNGNYFPTNYDKPHDISLISTYNLTKRYSLSVNGTYQTGRPITYPVGKYEYAGIEHVLYSDRNQFRIPDYFRIDLGINIEGNHKIKKIAHSFWNFSVYNVLGRNNPYSVFFINDEGSIKAYKTSVFSVPVPSITYNFTF